MPLPRAGAPGKAAAAMHDDGTRRVVTTPDAFAKSLENAARYAAIHATVTSAYYNLELDAVMVTFSTGAIIAVPRVRLPGFENATAEQLAEAEWSASGFQVRFPNAGAGFTSEAFVHYASRLDPWPGRRPTAGDDAAGIA